MTYGEVRVLHVLMTLRKAYYIGKAWDSINLTEVKETAGL